MWGGVRWWGGMVCEVRWGEVEWCVRRGKRASGKRSLDFFYLHCASDIGNQILLKHIGFWSSNFSTITSLIYHWLQTLLVWNCNSNFSSTLLVFYNFSRILTTIVRFILWSYCLNNILEKCHTQPTGLYNCKLVVVVFHLMYHLLLSNYVLPSPITLVTTVYC